MRINYFLPVAVLSFAAVLNAQSIDQKLKWVRETIDAHAETHQFEPPAKSSGTKWQVARIEGCTIELKQTSPSRVARLGGFGRQSVRHLRRQSRHLDFRPRQPAAAAHHGRFHRRRARGHFRASGHLSHQDRRDARTLRKDGTVAGTSTWSAPWHRAQFVDLFRFRLRATTISWSNKSSPICKAPSCSAWFRAAIAELPPPGRSPQVVIAVRAAPVPHPRRIAL